MKKESLHLFLVFALVAGGATATEPGTQSPILATLTLPHDMILPGVPFDLVVTLKNVSDKTATVGLAAQIIVIAAGGQKLVSPNRSRVSDGAHFNFGTLTPTKPHYLYVPLAPGESVQKVVHWDRSMASWFRYSAFSYPGIYDIAIELEDGGGDHFEDFVNYVGILRTSTARLHRVVTGVDAALWGRLQEVSDGKWSDNWFTAKKEGVALAEEIVAKHPDSSYYPYALFMTRIFNRNYGRDDIEPLLDAAKRFPDSPAYPYLLKGAGDAAFVEGTRAARVKDNATAEKYFDLAEKCFRDALRTNSLAIRAQSEERIRSLAWSRPRNRTE